MSATLDEKLEFRVAVLAADGGCIAAGKYGDDCEGDVQAHHVITQQQLRQHGLDDLLWDPTNGAAVCATHHRRHHSRRQPIRTEFLPARCLVFAAKQGLGWIIERYYE